MCDGHKGDIEISVHIIYIISHNVLTDIISSAASYITHGNGMQLLRGKIERRNLGLLVDPLSLALLVLLELGSLEPEANLLLGALDAVGAVADVAADVLHKH